jgi:hypothetical protein
MTAPDPLIPLVTKLTSSLDDLTGQFTALSTRLDDTSSFTHRTRHLTIGLAISVTLDVLLSVFLIITAANQGSISSRTNAALVSSCQQSNINKANDIRLWNATLAADHPATAAGKATLAEQHILVNVRDKQVNCIARYH